MTSAHGFLLFLCLIWGTTFPLVQMGLADSSPFAFLAARFLIAAVVFPLLVWPRAFRIDRDIFRKGVALGILLFLGFALQTFGLAHTTAARAAFITGLFVPLTPVFAFLIYRERIVARLILAVLLAFAGLLILSWPNADGGGLQIGDVMVFGCAVSFALQVVFVDKWVKSGSEYPLTWMQFLCTLVFASFFFPFVPLEFELTGRLFWILLYCAIPGGAIAIWFQLRYQPRMSSTAAAVIYATEPIFAAIAAWVLQGHIPPRATLIGGAFIVAGMLLSVPVKKVLSSAAEAVSFGAAPPQRGK